MHSVPWVCLAVVVLALSASAAAEGGGAATGAVQVEIRKEGGGFRLYRGGKPYYIQGAVYWGDPRGKFPLADLAARGGNSVRCGGGHIAAILDEAARLGVTVTVGLRMKMEAVHKFDYDDEQAVRKQFEEVKAAVLAWKDHPAVLMWGVGNELSMAYKNRKVWDAVNDVSKMIHEVDGKHPTMTVIGDGSVRRGDIQEIRRRCGDLDLLGVNYYKGVETVPETVRKEGWDKPYCITEWGPSGHWQVPKTKGKVPIEETSTEKAALYQQRYEATMRKDTEMCLGSYAFIWGAKQERTHTWYGMFLASGERTEAVNVMQFLWTGRWPANRAPRIASPAIDGKRAIDSVRLKPRTPHEAKVEAEDPDGDRPTFDWEILPEPEKFGYGGGGERKCPAVPNVIRQQAGGGIRLEAPDKEGSYRLFVIVRDGAGNAATANIPFYVEP